MSASTTLLGRLWCICWQIAQHRGSEDLPNLYKWLLGATLVNYPLVRSTGIILINIAVSPLAHSGKCFYS